MPRLRASGVAFAHSDAAPLFSDVSFCLEDGFTGLVGENGAGKTTLLRLLARELAPDRGAIALEPAGGRLLICPQEIEACGAEVRALAGADGGDARRWLGLLALDPAALERWPTLSPGERKRWQIGAALAAEPDALLLDEPTNHLDAEGRALLLRALARFRGVGVVVAHDRAVLESLTRATLRVHRGRVALWPGAYGAARALWTANAAALAEAHEAARRKEKRLRAQLDQARRDQVAASANRSTGKQMRSKYDSDARGLSADYRLENAERAHAKRVGALHSAVERAANEAPAEPMVRAIGRSIAAGHERAARPVIAARDAGPLLAGGVALFDAPALVLRRESRVHVAGPNGTGKSTLFAELARAAALPDGALFTLPQELDEAARVEALAELHALAPGDRGRALQLVAALGVEPARLIASALPSPGEARKLLLARALSGKSHALFLDEPTNHLDLPAIERLEEALCAWPGALLLITHDDALAARVCSERWLLGPRGIEVSSIDG